MQLLPKYYHCEIFGNFQTQPGLKLTALGAQTTELQCTSNLKNV